MTPAGEVQAPRSAKDGVLLAFPITHPRDSAAGPTPYNGTDGALALKAEPQPLGLYAPNGAAADKSAAIVARALLEVLTGWRPASQLARWTSHALQQDLERRAPRRPIGRRQRLLKLRVSEQSPGVAEICAISHDPGRGRVRVMAFRLEAGKSGWIVTRLQAG